MAVKSWYSRGLSEQTIVRLSLSLCYRLWTINQVTVPKGQLLGPGEVFKHILYTLNSSCPLKMPLNQIKIASLSKSRINFLESPGWRRYFYLWSHLILEEFNSPFFKAWLGVL